MAVKATGNWASIAVQAVDEVIQGIVTVVAHSIMRVEVVFFMAVDACGQVTTVQTSTDIAWFTLFSVDKIV